MMLCRVLSTLLPSIPKYQGHHADDQREQTDDLKVLRAPTHSLGPLAEIVLLQQTNKIERTNRGYQAFEIARVVSKHKALDLVVTEAGLRVERDVQGLDQVPADLEEVQAGPH